MDQGIVGRIEGWETRPVAGGYAGLRDLADAEFSGAVSADGAWLFMLNGRIVGVFDGALSTFEGADATAHVAPHPSLPLLFAMQESDGETRARYYTDDTPLSEVNATLNEGSFTGYVELSENVLSGDYYVVFYGGRSMSAAFIGESERLVTGEEAFERANDEVGIYEVRSVELEVLEVPEPESDPAPATGESGGVPDSEPEAEPGTEVETAGDADDESVDGAAEESSPAGTEASSDGPIEEAESVGQEAEGEANGRSDPETPTAADADGGDGTPASPEERRPREGDAREPADGPAEADDGAPSREASADPFSEEQEWRETRTIPALDPEESEGRAEAAEARAERNDAGADPAPAAETDAGAGRPADGSREGRIRTAIAEREERIEALEGRLEEAEAERDRLREERDRLRDRVDRLEERLEADDGTASAAGPDLDPAEALSATDLFVRYGSKGKATLDDAHDGEATKEDVNANLRLEEHTRFEAEETTVAGRPFREFLASTLQYRFVRWVIEDLLYEIRETGKQKELRDLYDALSRIDRVAFEESVSVRDEEGEERRETFDVVFRDRMGQPLVVADMNDARDPATGEMMGDLVERTSGVTEGIDTVAAAFLVTASFFQPDALETAADATGSGLLDRDPRESFVKLTRKQGYHLCLVEARDDAFHVAVPEL